jgi:methionine sulfoxide reductase heme-binding subunit
MKKFWLSPWTRALVFLLCLVPFFDLVWRFQHHQLTINPIEYITHRTGDWAQLIRFRRMTGLFAFFYACLHFTTWFYLDKDLDTREMWEDIIKRRFITMGMFGLLVMLPLAMTSTAGWVRRLGFRKWQLLQRGIYLSALAGVIHYYWGVKSDIRLPVLYAFILGLLLAWRIVAALRPKPAAAARSSVRATPPLRPPADARE